MRIFEKIRNTAFWSVDRLRGGSIQKHFREIRFEIENHDSLRALEYRETCLDNILNHATTNTTFYSGYQGFESLSDFPVIDKNTVINNFDSLKSITHLNARYFEVSTSGSTGIPFRLHQDENKKSRNTADTIYFAKIANYDIGNRFVYLRDWDYQSRKNKLSYVLRNIRRINSNHFDEEILYRFIDLLQKDRYSSVNIMGYPSAFEVILDYLDETSPELQFDNVLSIIAIAEALDPKTKMRLSQYFNCPIVSRYSNNELGILAQQNIGDSEFMFNSASYLVEILKLDENVPVTPGETGRIVVTDYFNYCMPMIRYDTGDLGIISPEKGLPFLSSVEGRKMDMIYGTNGDMVSPHNFAFLAKYRGLKQYQFVQKGEKDYLCKLNVVGISPSEEEKVETNLKKLLGEDAEIHFEYVDEIPLLSSGKRKKVANEFR
jgi:phenylacetate-CoA ligase